MGIDLSKLNYKFKNKPLLVGGMAMEYYGLRKSGKDIDFIASEEDIIELIKRYPNRVKDLWGDLGVCPLEFEIWKTICCFEYDDLKEDAIEIEDILIISVEKLLLMKTLAMKEEKYLKDTQLIVEHILENQYKDKYENIKQKNESILKNLNNIEYIEKTGPET